MYPTIRLGNLYPITFPFAPLLFILFFAACSSAPSSSSRLEDNKSKTQIPDNNNAMPDSSHLEKATLGNGCFWCTDAIYRALEGVKDVVVGYTGGEIENPTYEQVCSGTTGHAEVAQITFDSAITSYEEILEVFWKTHNPTTLNRQGADVGTQYRSEIFYHDEAQKRIAQASLAAMEESGLWEDPVVTKISSLGVFYPAEAYHQDYFKNNPNQGYCVAVVGPKLEKFKKLFKDKLKN